jgi:hypothetical protein
MNWSNQIARVFACGFAARWPRIGRSRDRRRYGGADTLLCAEGNGPIGSWVGPLNRIAGKEVVVRGRGLITTRRVGGRNRTCYHPEFALLRDLPMAPPTCAMPTYKILLRARDVGEANHTHLDCHQTPVTCCPIQTSRANRRFDPGKSTPSANQVNKPNAVAAATPVGSNENVPPARSAGRHVTTAPATTVTSAIHW